MDIFFCIYNSKFAYRTHYAYKFAVSLHHLLHKHISHTNCSLLCLCDFRFLFVLYYTLYKIWFFSLLYSSWRWRWSARKMSIKINEDWLCGAFKVEIFFFLPAKLLLYLFILLWAKNIKNFDFISYFFSYPVFRFLASLLWLLKLNIFHYYICCLFTYFFFFLFESFIHKKILYSMLTCNKNFIQFIFKL